MAHFGQAGVSPDGTVAYATVTFEGKDFNDLSTADVTTALNLIKAQNGKDGLQVGANGVFGFVGGEPPSSESIGVTVALVILLFAFGSILGAFLPIVSAALSVALATTFALPLVARFFDVATFAPILASMIGLGVGIDYSLFVINRYREAIIHGRAPREAALESVRTSGRAVQFAAATVIIALLGLFVMRITFFNGIAVAAAVTVFMVMVGALLLLPAVLSLLGTWAFVGRMAWITDEEAIPQQRLTGVRHTIGRLLRYLGWILVPPGHPDRAGLAPARAPRQGAGPAPTERLRAVRQLAAEAAVADRRVRARRHARDRASRCCRCGWASPTTRAPRQGSPPADRVRPDRRGLRARRQRTVLHRRASCPRPATRRP